MTSDSAWETGYSGCPWDNPAAGHGPAPAPGRSRACDVWAAPLDALPGRPDRRALGSAEPGSRPAPDGPFPSSSGPVPPPERIPCSGYAGLVRAGPVRGAAGRPRWVSPRAVFDAATPGLLICLALGGFIYVIAPVMLAVSFGWPAGSRSARHKSAGASSSPRRRGPPILAIIVALANDAGFSAWWVTWSACGVVAVGAHGPGHVADRPPQPQGRSATRAAYPISLGIGPCSQSPGPEPLPVSLLHLGRGSPHRTAPRPAQPGPAAAPGTGRPGPARSTSGSSVGWAAGIAAPTPGSAGWSPRGWPRCPIRARPADVAPAARPPAVQLVTEPYAISVLCALARG